MRMSAGVAGVAAFTVVIGFAQSAPAQIIFDHLKCYKVKNLTKPQVKGLVDLEPLQTNFLAEKDCKITGPKLLCVPVSKQNVRAVPPPQPAPAGPEEIDHICYALRCRKPFPGPVDVVDQFGKFTLKPTGTGFLCTPARKATTTTTTTTTSTTSTIITTTSTTTTTTQLPCRNMAPSGGSPMCAGGCPPAVPKCLFIPATGECECVPNDQMCMPSGTAGQCSGLCPNATEQCIPDGTGGCDCRPPLDCGATEPPACGGLCPPGEECRQASPTACTCVLP